MKQKKINPFFSLLTFICLFAFFACNKEYNYPNTTGKGGSMARFTIAKDHLYVIDDLNLKVFSITQADAPVYIKDIYIGTAIETVFPYNNNLFIGSQNGMYIYDISNASDPVYISEMIHIFSCDPVVVNDSLAFVTLRSGGDCRVSSNVNQLEIFDISNLNSPSLRAIYEMYTPYGLGIDSCLLFICHGDYGLGIYDFSNPDSISTLYLLTDLTTYDVIPHNKTLFVIGESGLYQYNYSDPDSIYLMSVISTGQ